MNKQHSSLIIVASVALLTGIVVDRVLIGKFVSTDTAEREPLYWVAPMDSNYRRDKPGKSPMGMDLVPVYADAEKPVHKAGTVNISPAVENRLGVRSEVVSKSDLQLKIATVGYVSFDEQRLLHMHSRVDGWIEKLAVTAVGDPVKKGQKLFELYSPELVYAQEEYLSALRAGSSSLLRASTSKLKALGVSQKQITELRNAKRTSQYLAFYAQQDGYVSELNVREGMFIEPATTVMSIGNLDLVWVIAEVFERQAALVKEGQAVTMKISSYPGEHWQGQVDYVYPVVNAATRTLRARIKFSNPDHRLKPDMFAELDIHAGKKTAVLSVPREAVIRDGRMSRVVKALGDGRYISSRIETGLEVGDRVEVVSGLTADDQVVISAQFLIDSESSISADLERFKDDSYAGEKSAHEMHQHMQVGHDHD